MLRVLLASILIIVPGVVLAGDSLQDGAAERIRPVVSAAIEYYNERSDDPLPALSSDQVDGLLEGEVVRIRRRPRRDQDPAVERVTGYRIVPTPRLQVWVAALDPDFRATSLLSEARLSQDGAGSSLWHQYLSLPWPIQDRHWVIRVGPRVDLARETGGLVWEQEWALASDGEEIAARSIAAGNLAGVTPESSRDAVYVPANEGSWVMFRVEDGVTLVAYRVVARLGGRIPDSWIATFGMAQLASVLDEVARHALEVPQVFAGRPVPVQDGRGHPIGGF